MDCSSPGSFVHRILQAIILDWVVVSSFRASSQPRDQTCISYCSLHWQVSSLPLMLPGKSNIHLVFFYLQNVFIDMIMLNCCNRLWGGECHFCLKDKKIKVQCHGINESDSLQSFSLRKNKTRIWTQFLWLYMPCSFHQWHLHNNSLFQSASASSQNNPWCQPPPCFHVSSRRERKFGEEAALCPSHSVQASESFLKTGAGQ